MKYRIVLDGGFFYAEKFERDRWWYVTDTASKNAEEAERLVYASVISPPPKSVIKEFEA